MSLTTAEEILPATANGRKRWIRANVEFLENSGLLTGRYELLDGEIVLKMGQNRRHALAVMRIVAYLLSVFGAERLQTQATMEVREEDKITNKPEPDVVVLREAIDRNANGMDVLLAVEISDSTQSDDLGHKVKLYARAGVEEYWVLDTTAGKLFAFRQTDAANGEGKDRTELTSGDRVAPVAAPGSVVIVASLLT